MSIKTRHILVVIVAGCKRQEQNIIKDFLE